MACGVAAALLGVATGCSNSSSKGGDSAFADSLSTYMGLSQGYRLSADYRDQLPDEEKPNMKKEDILRGIKQVIMTDSTQRGYLIGLQFGLQMMGQIAHYEQSGIEVDRAKIYDAYAKSFMTDTCSQEELREMQLTYQSLTQQAQQKMMEYYAQQEAAAREEKAKSPEAQKNMQEGQDYIEQLCKEDPSVKVTDSGLAYKVITEGAGEEVGPNGRAVVKYSGTFLDGNEFDSNQNGVTFSPRNVVPGFGEGLSMMKKGSHYVLYIPGPLAYGVEGAPQAGIGPNQMLVFDVVVDDVIPAGN